MTLKPQESVPGMAGRGKPPGVPLLFEQDLKDQKRTPQAKARLARVSKLQKQCK